MITKSKKEMFKGSFPALITPFRNGAVDIQAFIRLIERQIEAGCHGLVPCGTTGESATLTPDEHFTLVKQCVDTVDGRVPIIAGSGSNSTAGAIAKAKAVKEAGADAALIVTPYYNKPSQEGVYQHFKMIHDSVDIPIILYNVPGRTVVDMEIDTVCRLAELERVIGIKDASEDLDRLEILKQRIDKEFCYLSGNDDSAGEYLRRGGDGVISVCANVAAEQVAAMQTAWMSNDTEIFEELEEILEPMNVAMFCDASPAPAKYALWTMGLCENELRLPMVSACAQAKIKIDDAMEVVGLETKEAA